MRDYMKALHLRFENPSRQAMELERQVTTLHKQLASRLAKPEQKILLRLIDLVNELRSQSDLDSFLSGFRLADGIHRDLSEQPPCSFEAEFDFDDGDFLFSISDGMDMDSDGHMIMGMGNNVAIDLDSGELHIISGWPDAENND